MQVKLRGNVAHHQTAVAVGTHGEPAGPEEKMLNGCFVQSSTSARKNEISMGSEKKIIIGSDSGFKYFPFTPGLVEETPMALS